MRRKSGVKAGAALLALSLTLGMLFACASKDSDSSQTSETLASSEETTSEVDVISVLGSMKSVDYQGEVFHIWTSNVVNSALTLRQAPDETMDGEQINDALYTRDRLIESKYNIKIQYNIVEPDAEFQLYNKASKVIMSDSGDIHLIFGNMQVYAVEFIKNKLIFDIKSIPEINLSNEWWHQIALRDLDISGKMYFATGDITPRYVFSPFIVLFNKQLFEDYGYEYPYKAVENGTWTMDMILGLIKGTYRDLDGDNRRGLGDFYGFSNEGWAYPFFNGFGDTAMSVGSGEPVINCTTESAVNKIMKVGELFASDDIFFKNERTQYDFSDIFEDNRALLCSQTATNLYLLTDMDTDYGVLPLPKFNETQDKYYSFVNGYCATAIMIPISVQDTSMVGTITEAMAAASRYTSTPAAYEVTLLTKQTRDEESVEMLRLSAESAVYDLSMYFDWGGITTSLNGLMLSGGSNVSSKIAAVTKPATKAAQTSLEKILGN